MKFSTRRDTELTADQLFQSVTNFDRLERVLLRRGAAVTRRGQATEAGIGTGWDIGFDWRGKRRDLQIDVVRFDQPERVAMQGLSEAFEIAIELTIVALSRTRSRLIFETDLRPRTMRSRLILQTARLGKAQMDRQFDEGVGRLLAELMGSRA